MNGPFLYRRDPPSFPSAFSFSLPPTFQLVFKPPSFPSLPLASLPHPSWASPLYPRHALEGTKKFRRKVGYRNFVLGETGWVGRWRGGGDKAAGRTNDEGSAICFGPKSFGEVFCFSRAPLHSTAWEENLKRAAFLVGTSESGNERDF